jgi:hypothetical protein
MIALSILPSEKIATALSLAAELEKAVGDGAMSKVDELSDALLDMAQCKRPVRISDASWMEFNRKIRYSMPGYATSYVIPPETCSKLLSLVGDEDTNGLRALLDTAVSSRSHLLQIPLDSE